MREWAKTHGVKRQNLAKALTGAWKGPRATELVELAVAFINERGPK